MTNEQINFFYESLKFFKTTKEYEHDRENIRNCEYHLVNYHHHTAYAFVQKLLREYETGMNLVSEFNKGFKVVITQTPTAWTDEEIRHKLIHFHDYIPAYAFSRECKKEIAKQILFGLANGLK